MRRATPFLVLIWLMPTLATTLQPSGGRPAPAIDPANVAILVRPGTPNAAAPSNLAAIATDLADALHSRGFRIAPSVREATAIVEILGRRQLGQRLSANSTSVAPVEVVRTHITMGDDTAEVRGYSSGTRQLRVSAEVAAAAAIQRWFEGRHMPPARERQGVSAPDAPLDTVLARAATYVADYEHQFATVIGQERYRQQFTQERTIDAETLSVRVTKTSRLLESELSFAWFPDVPGWFGFRDVIEVDGKPVKDRDRRLAILFFQKPTGALLKRALQESARYNLGTIRRNFNVPMVALQFLGADVAARFQFDEAEPELIGDQPVRVVRYRETSHPTMIMVNDEANAPAQGRFWIDADTGRVLKTELVIGHRYSDIRIVTWYASDPRLGIWVPSRMTESYDYAQRLYDAIECEATYANFRRFETGARIVSPK